jgi:hypothetical protein
LNVFLPHALAVDSTELVKLSIGSLLRLNLIPRRFLVEETLINGTFSKFMKTLS